MRSKNYLKFRLGLICLFVVLAGLLSSATNLTVTSAGRVTYVAGVVNVRMSQLVGPGYRLRTGNNGRVELTFANGHRLRIGPMSDLLLVAKPQQTKTLLHLNQGRVWNNVKPGAGNNVVVRTKYSTASVLGTIYDTTLGGLSSKTTVLHGSVGVHRPENEPVENLFESVPALPSPTPTPKSNSFQAPTVIANPVHQVQSTIRVVPGPYTVSQDQWLQIIENQQVSMAADGKADIRTVDPAELQKTDEWFRWNQQMDAKAAQE